MFTGGAALAAGGTLAGGAVLYAGAVLPGVYAGGPAAEPFGTAESPGTKVFVMRPVGTASPGCPLTSPGGGGSRRATCSGSRGGVDRLMSSPGAGANVGSASVAAGGALSAGAGFSSAGAALAGVMLAAEPGNAGATLIAGESLV